MVNTRRMESNGSGPYSRHRYSTRVCMFVYLPCLSANIMRYYLVCLETCMYKMLNIYLNASTIFVFGSFHVKSNFKDSSSSITFNFIYSSAECW